MSNGYGLQLDYISIFDISLIWQVGEGMGGLPQNNPCVPYQHLILVCITNTNPKYFDGRLAGPVFSNKK